MNIHTIANYIEDNLTDVEMNYKIMCKLLYFIQAWHIGYYQKKLLFKDVPIAYCHGPGYKSMSIKYYGENYADDHIITRTETNEIIPEVVKDIIDSVIKKYGHQNQILLQLVCENDVPWIIARKNLDRSDIFGYEKYDMKVIKKYYAGKIKKIS